MLKAGSELRHDGIIPDEIMNNGPNAIQKNLPQKFQIFFARAAFKNKKRGKR